LGLETVTNLAGERTYVIGAAPWRSRWLLDRENAAMNSWTENE